MKNYKIFANQGQKVAVKEGWSWPAFFFAGFWAFTKGMVIPGIVGILFYWPPAYLITAIIFGSKGNKWWEGKLLKNGFAMTGSVRANSPQEAVAK